MCERLADQKTNLQNNIDRMFANSYQYLILNMWNISEFEYDEKYKRFNKKFNYLDDGQASKRVIEECIKWEI